MWEFRFARLMTSGPPPKEPKGGVPVVTWAEAGRGRNRARRRRKRVAGRKKQVPPAKCAVRDDKRAIEADRRVGDMGSSFGKRDFSLRSK